MSAEKETSGAVKPTIGQRIKCVLYFILSGGWYVDPRHF